jgi:hypothetical protein
MVAVCIDFVCTVFSVDLFERFVDTLVFFIRAVNSLLLFNGYVIAFLDFCFCLNTLPLCVMLA